MKVRDLMSAGIESCTPETDLATAAMVMWRQDCGIVPVATPGTKKLLGVITDRDICMAVATTGQRPTERRVADVMARTPCTVRAENDAVSALAVMEREHVRRLPVVDAEGVLLGMLSINDLILATGRSPGRGRARLEPGDVLRALRGICAHRRTGREEALVRSGAGGRGEIRKEVRQHEDVPA